jgi:hypothetical protein
MHLQEESRVLKKPGQSVTPDVEIKTEQEDHMTTNKPTREQENTQ